MSAIMRGTTPTIEVTIEDELAEDFPMSSVSEIEFCVRNGTNVTTYNKADLVIDEENATVTKYMTEEETKALDPNFPVIVQMRFFFPDGNVIGIDKLVFDVADMEGV